MEQRKLLRRIQWLVDEAVSWNYAVENEFSYTDHHFRQGDRERRRVRAIGAALEALAKQEPR